MVKAVTIFSIIIALIGVAFLGKGITGMYFIDFKLPACSINEDCSGNVCCKFYNADYGVCDAEDKCDAILTLTKEEYQRMSNLQVDESMMKRKMYSVMQAHRESPAQQSHMNSILVGLVLALFAVVALMIKDEKKEETNE